jgi:endonuclease/exonuclease/phosphatase family metal-dependent hydrolase
MKRLADEVFEESNGLTIVLGDFNEWIPGNRSLCLLNSCLGSPPSLRTFPSFFPVLPLDRVWIRPLDALADISVHRTRLSRSASDHLPLKANIAIRKQTEA